MKSIELSDEDYTALIEMAKELGWEPDWEHDCECEY